MNIKTLCNIGIVIFIYYLAHYIYLGIIQPIPALGDSWDYHIPISQSILNGEFLTMPNALIPQHYYPGSSEAINSILMLLHIPLTLSNIVAVLVLFFVCFKLALTFRLPYYLSIFFALTICTLNVFVRWYNAVSIDVWLVNFFLLAIILLEKPKKTPLYIFSLGLVLGMLIGSKYTGLIFLAILIAFYFKHFYLAVFNKYILLFILPFSFFGLFWYVRNYILMQNPFYPLPLFGFSGKRIFTDTVFSESLQQPLIMLNAIYGEYNIWILLIVGMIIFYLLSILRRNPLQIKKFHKLFWIGIICLLTYFTFPTSEQSWIMVSSLRYSYPAFIPLILCVFLLFTYLKKETLLGYAAIGSMLMVISMTYYPKLTVIYIPLSFLAVFIMNFYASKFKSYKNR